MDGLEKLVVVSSLLNTGGIFTWLYVRFYIVYYIINLLMPCYNAFNNIAGAHVLQPARINCTPYNYFISDMGRYINYQINV